jgi:hypothetical protein
MIQVNALKINFLYPRDFDPHNHDLVAYVIQKYPRKVVKGVIITRPSLEAWYVEACKEYSGDKYVVLIGTVSLVGVVEGLQAVDHEDAGSTKTINYVRKTKDPSAN